MHDMEWIKVPLRGKNGAGRYTLVDGDYDGEYFSTLKLYLSPRGYVTTKIEGKYFNLHSLVCPPKKGAHVDHIDRDKLNNRSCNLRYVTPSENFKNSERYDQFLAIPPEIRDEKRAKRRREYERNSQVRKAWRVTYDKRRREEKRLRYITN